MYQVIKKPLVSEKNAVHSEQSNTFAFEVDRRSTKSEIKSAIEKSFGVQVVEVRTMVCRGKFFRKQARLGAPKPWKKALVKLKQGEKLSIFEGA
jgi:large subunit ribosomal protein L23